METDKTNISTRKLRRKSVKRDLLDSIQSVKKSASLPFLFPYLSYKIVGTFFKVHSSYGSGQKEAVYQNALAEELDELNIPYKRESSIPIKSVKTSKTLGSYKLDFVIDNKIIVEAKAVKFTPSKIEQQLYSYLKSTPYKIGYLVNFGSSKLFFKRVTLT